MSESKSEIVKNILSILWPTLSTQSSTSLYGINLGP